MSGLFRGIKLFRNDGVTVDPNSLKNKIVCLYFSASWCPPCRQFTPILSDFYEETQKDVEVIFLSADKSESEFRSYHGHMPWLAVEWNHSIIQGISERYKVTGLPTLLVIQDTGDVLTADGRRDVTDKGPGAVKEWQKSWKGDRWANLGAGNRLDAGASPSGPGDAATEREKRARALEARLARLQPAESQPEAAKPIVATAPMPSTAPEPSTVATAPSSTPAPAQATPSPIAIEPERPGWCCQTCTFANSSNATDCSMCATPGPPRPPSPQNEHLTKAIRATEQWQCAACTLIQDDSVDCAACGLPRPV